MDIPQFRKHISMAKKFIHNILQKGRGKQHITKGDPKNLMRGKTKGQVRRGPSYALVGLDNQTH
jgi:hypothetical protein